MKNRQSGFTLIELVVVFVILGILAATAIPKFTAVTDDARSAVADGILGGILSAAVIQFASSGGSPSSFATIWSQLDCDTDDAVTTAVNGGAALAAVCGGAATSTCGPATAASTVRVTVGGQQDTRTTIAQIPAGLCSG